MVIKGLVAKSERKALKALQEETTKKAAEKNTGNNDGDSSKMSDTASQEVNYSAALSSLR